MTFEPFGGLMTGRSGARLLLAFGVSLILPLAGCTGEDAAQQGGSSTIPELETSHSCPSGTNASDAGRYELVGSSSNGILWALMFSDLPVPSREDIKIVIKVTGEGPIELWAEGPRGLRVEPDNTTAHPGSNWQRPGDEWGTFWTFPSEGCWTVLVERTSTRGHFRVPVSA